MDTVWNECIESCGLKYNTEETEAQIENRDCEHKKPYEQSVQVYDIIDIEKAKKIIPFPKEINDIPKVIAEQFQLVLDLKLRKINCHNTFLLQVSEMIEPMGTYSEEGFTAIVEKNSKELEMKSLFNSEKRFENACINWEKKVENFENGSFRMCAEQVIGIVNDFKVNKRG